MIYIEIDDIFFGNAFLLSLQNIAHTMILYENDWENKITRHITSVLVSSPHKFVENTNINFLS